MIEVCEQNRFTRYLPGSEMAVLESWQRWFKSTGVPARIVLGRKGFAVYREGLVVSEPAWKRQTNKPVPYGFRVDRRIG